jgi:hypothetical protein
MVRLNCKALLLVLLAILTLVSKKSSAQKIAIINSTAQQITVDGLDNDAAWQALPNVAGEFTQIQPKFLQPSDYKTEVKLCYSGNGIYILATCFQDKSSILKQLCERDRIGDANADNFSIYFDTYNDKQNGFAFKVSAANVQQDEKLLGGGSPGGFGGGNGDADASWDAVWESAVKIFDNKWCAEFYIPFSAVRIPNKAEQVWGINFRRSVRKVNEASFWNTYDPNKAGFLLQSGTLQGLKNIKPPLRLALFPYLSTGVQSIPDGNGGRQTQWLKSGGADIKYGINDAFTLDMSLIPDFSQVVSDNLIRNLSPFEQQLSENRPFFTEGVELFNKQDMFYSRRIGQRPNGYYNVLANYGNSANYAITKNPNISTLYNTFKISGRTSNDLGIGIFNALQSNMYAVVKHIPGDSSFSVKTGDLTNYNMIVFDKALPHQSSINFTNANTIRANGAADANVAGLQAEILNKKETHRLFVSTKLSSIFGKNLNTQLGTLSTAEYGKVEGKFKWTVGGTYWSKQFNQTDMGIQFDYNHLELRQNASYQENKPKAKFLNLYRTWFNQNITLNANPMITKSYEFETGLFWLFKNFVDVTWYAGGEPAGIKDFYQISKFDRPLWTSGYVYTGSNGSSDSRKRFFTYWDGSYGRNFQAGWTYREISNGYRYRFNDHFQLSTGLRAVWNHANVGRTNEYFSLSTPLVVFRHVNEYTWDVNAQYNFNANSNLSFRFRHYSTFITAKRLFSVDEDGYWINNEQQLSAIPIQDENFNLQNIDIFYNWIFKPGSRLIISYKQWLNDEYILNDQQNGQRFVDNVYQIMPEPRAFLLAARMIWYIDYNSLRKK